MGPMRAVLAVALTLQVVAAGACRKRAPDVPPPQERQLPALQVEKQGKWLFTYVDESGRFVTTEDVASIPAASRRLVRVIDPSRAAHERRDGLTVYVVDVDQLAREEKVTARALSREAFETGALAQLAPGESSMLPPPGGAPPPPAEAPGAPVSPGSAAGPSAGPPVVTLYGTAWCGACKSARSYLRERRIAFADKDIERDPTAARELKEKARRLGVPAGSGADPGCAGPAADRFRQGPARGAPR